MTRVVETERLILRPWQNGEFEVLCGIIGDARTMAAWPAPLMQAQMKDWFEKAQADWESERLGRWAILRKADGLILGDCGLVAKQIQGRPITDLCYILHVDHHRQGYGLEAARAALAYGLERGLPNIVCHMAQDNLPSRRVAERLGLRHTDTFIHDGNLGKTHLVFTP